MAKLDQIEHNHSDKDENKGMGAAVEATEEIRRWEEHLWDHNKIFEKLHSSRTDGLTSDKAHELFIQIGENALSERV